MCDTRSPLPRQMEAPPAEDGEQCQRVDDNYRASKRKRPPRKKTKTELILFHLLKKQVGEKLKLILFRAKFPKVVAQLNFEYD